MKPLLERLRNRVERAMRSSDPAPLLSLEAVLHPLSMVYGGVMRLRARLYARKVLPSKSLPCRVVSIGNLTTGGTGKTPMAVLVAQHIQARGYRVAVVSRGYRGRREASGGVVSDGQTIFEGPDAAGDEPHLMARVLAGIPVLVGRDRFAVGTLAVERFDPEVIVLDDAFQHLRLKRDLDIVLLDGRSPFGNGFLVPRGMLREPVSALRRADAVVFTRSDPGAAMRECADMPAHCPVFRARHAPVVRCVDPQSGGFLTQTTDIAMLAGERVVAFAGLADNEQFFAGLARAGCILAETLAFTDHYRYRSGDLERLAQVAGATGAAFLVTTLKDYVKIERWTPPVALVAVDAGIQFVDSDDIFHALIAHAIDSEHARRTA
ncbi:MAG TPA: tetraacyldisaccharide 4'-kinase [Desulfosarcina sp.]|nr:tetraacyldisaccharide 4'-kinase [Desulfosarcina sp.]